MARSRIRSKIQRREKDAEFPDSVRTLVVKLDDKGSFYLFEFSVYEDDEGQGQIDIERVWK